MGNLWLLDLDDQKPKRGDEISWPMEKADTIQPKNDVFVVLSIFCQIKYQYKTMHSKNNQSLFYTICKYGHMELIVIVNDTALMNIRT